MSLTTTPFPHYYSPPFIHSFPLTGDGDPKKVSEHDVGRVRIHAVKRQDREKDHQPEDDPVGQGQLQVAHAKEDDAPTQVQRSLSSERFGGKGGPGGAYCIVIIIHCSAVRRQVDDFWSPRIDILINILRIYRPQMLGPMR